LPVCRLAGTHASLRPMFERRLALESIHTLSRRYFVMQYRCPDIAAAAQPGHFVMISVSDTIDPLLRRPMAIYRIVREAGAAVGFTLLVEQTGRGTTLMARARPGDLADVLGPLGCPFRLPAAQVLDDEEDLLVMGGVGAAPFPLLAETLTNLGARVRSFVGGRSRENLLCLDDFVEMDIPVHTATDDGSAGHHGFVTGALEAHLGLAAGSPRIYSCGPTPMMRAVDEVAARHGCDHQVSLEAPMACGIGVCLSCVVPVERGDARVYERICREGPVFDAATLGWR